MQVARYWRMKEMYGLPQYTDASGNLTIQKPFDPEKSLVVKDEKRENPDNLKRERVAQ